MFSKNLIGRAFGSLGRALSGVRNFSTGGGCEGLIDASKLTSAPESINPHIGQGCFIRPEVFDKAARKFRDFCHSKGMLEVHGQSRLSILASCEQPETLVPFTFGTKFFPFVQTSQMWLEYEMLTNPDRANGYFSISTSYRHEPNPEPGRHHLIFPMFEFELKGGMDELIKFETEFLDYLGYNTLYDGEYPSGNYEDVAKRYGVHELENEHENRLGEEHGAVFFLKNFPIHTSPFWNMARDPATGTSCKIDVLLDGVETIGSAERSCDPDEMFKQFHTISDGGYAKILYDTFGEERVRRELDDFLSLEFFQRFGGGIGVSRICTSLENHGLL